MDVKSGLLTSCSVAGETLGCQAGECARGKRIGSANPSCSCFGNVDFFANVRRLRGFIDTLSRERRKNVMLSQDMRDLASHSGKLWTVADTLRKRNTKLTGEV